MTAPTCACCGRPTADGYVDMHCTGKAAGHLRAIAELAGAARLVAAGLVRRGDGGGGSNKPGSRSPGDDGAMDALDEIQNKITTIARDIAETRGLEILSDGRSRPLSVPVTAENHSAHPLPTPEPLEAF